MDEIVSLRAEIERLRRGGAELGKIVKWHCDMVLDATGLHDWIDEDGDGDWGAVWENLAELRPRAEAAEAEVERLRDADDRWHKMCDALTAELMAAGAKVAAVEAEAQWLNAHHDGSLVTSDYPMIARRIRAAVAGGGA
jgi:hypothetical protein